MSTFSEKKRELIRLLSDGKTIYLDEANTRVGISKKTPATTVHIGGDLTIDGTCYGCTDADAPSHTQDLTSSDPYGFTSNGSTSNGELLKIGSTTTVLSNLYYLTDSGAWALTDADAPATGGPSLIALAVGTHSGDDGMLVRGYARIQASLLASTATAKQGDPIYVDTATAGALTFTRPSGSGDIVRIVGYLIAPVDSNTDSVIYFCPDNTWVEIS